MTEKPRSCYAHPYANDVFFSYATKDDSPMSPFIQPSVLRNAIRTNLGERILAPCKYRTWLDRDDMENGDTLTSQIREALAGSAVLVVFLSAHYVRSKWCQEELRHFFRRCSWPRAESLMPYRLVVISLDGTSPTEIQSILDPITEERLDDIHADLAYAYDATHNIVPLDEAGLRKNEHNYAFSNFLERIQASIFQKLEYHRGRSPSVFLSHISSVAQQAGQTAERYIELFESYGVRVDYLEWDSRLSPEQNRDLAAQRIEACDIYFRISDSGATPLGVGLPSYEALQDDVYRRSVDAWNALCFVWERDGTSHTMSANSVPIKGTESSVFADVARRAYARRFWKESRVNPYNGVVLQQWHLLVICDPTDFEYFPLIYAAIVEANNTRAARNAEPLTYFVYDEDPPPGHRWEQVLFRPQFAPTETITVPWKLAVSIFAEHNTKSINRQLNAWTSEVPRINALNVCTNLLNVKFTPPAPKTPIIQSPPRSRVVDYNHNQLVDIFSKL